MEGMRSSGSPRGVSMIAALEILCGIGCFVLGLIFLLSVTVSGLLLIGSGVVLIAMGGALEALHSWAWWGSVLISAGSLLGILIGVLIDIPSASITLFSNIVSIALDIAIIVYLLTPGVRSQFSSG